MDSILKNNAEFDVVGIGSALLDFIVEVDDGLLLKIGFKKGEMHLIDGDMSRKIFSMLKNYPMEIIPGGSAANTVAGISNFSGKGLFLGKVGDDQHGDIYIKEIEKIGVKTGITRHNSITGHALTFITPDSERTFGTHLGAALQFNEGDVFEDDIKNCKILHLEGYLFEPLNLNKACMRAISIAKKNNTLVSIDLSDPALITRIHDNFKTVVRDYADIVFVNEEEAKAFTGKQGEEALNELYKMCDFAVVKLGPDGSLIRTDDSTYKISIFNTEVVNTNGAGDLYAAGVLYGIAKGFKPEKSGKLGSYASSLVVSQAGARLSGNINISEIEDL